jgi:large subunit ribosomal protein L25
MALLERKHGTMLIQASIDDLRNAIRHADGLGRLDIMVDGEKKARKAIVRTVENDPIKHQMIHVTLQEVSDDDMIRLDVPVVALGVPTAMEDTEFVLMQTADHLKIRGRMADMPEKIEVDVTGLELGHHISAGDVTLPEGMELQSSPETTLFTLRQPTVMTEEPAEAEAAEGEGEETPAEESKEEASE